MIKLNYTFANFCIWICILNGYGQSNEVTDIVYLKLRILDCIVMWRNVSILAFLLCRILCNIVVRRVLKYAPSVKVASLKPKQPDLPVGWRRICRVSSDKRSQFTFIRNRSVFVWIKIIQSFFFKNPLIDVRIAHQYIIVRLNMRTNIRDILL